MSETAIFDCIIVGGGHNGLVCAAYLAKKNKRVLILEKRDILGGACSTEPIFKGCKVSRAAYVLSLFHPQIIDDLELKSFGLTLLKRNPSSISLFKSQKQLILGSDSTQNINVIRKFSIKDAEAYPHYLRYLDSIVEFVNYTLTLTPPNIVPRSFNDLKRFVELSGHLFLHLRGAKDFLYLMTHSAADILNNWFESDELKGVLATDGIIGAVASPNTNGTGYILLHHVMGQVTAETGVWAYVQGGMGGLIDSLEQACLSSNVTIKKAVNVTHIDTTLQTKKVLLDNGDIYESPIIISNADPFVTSKLIGTQHLPKSYLKKIEQIDFSSPVVKINVHLTQLPEFTLLKEDLPNTELQGTLHIEPSIKDLDNAYKEAQQGQFSTKPLIEITLPSVLDKTLAPKGQHIMGIFSQYAPERIFSGHWDDEKQAYVDRIFTIIETFCPNFKSLIIDYDVLCPRDLEKIYSLTQGNIFHGAMTFNQLFSFRPVNGYADYKTPIDGVYLCGSGTHPGGGVTGLPGWNAARNIIQDLKL
tara:strand:- start:1141 stop:2730 length:1590 start_codon:yes stop_codon:yes gene_type:complete